MGSIAAIQETVGEPAPTNMARLQSVSDWFGLLSLHRNRNFPYIRYFL